MRENIRRFLLSLFFIVYFAKGYGEDITIEQLNELREKEMISQEDYNILVAELNGTLKNEQIYNLNVNGILIDNKFKVLTEGNTMYFPLFQFLELLGFANLKQTPTEMRISLNERFIIILNKKNNTIFLPNNEQITRELRNEKDYLIKENDEYYLKADIFKTIFLAHLVSEKDDSTIRMTLAFNTPKEAAILLNLRQEEIKRELEQNEIVYMNKRKFFELGNARVQLYQNFDKQTGKDGYKKDWEGNIEYQGAFLYGNLTTNYDFRKNEIGDAEIEYEDIFQGHNLRIGGYSGSGGSREFGFHLRKDRGYYELGRKLIISENVPIGSKVELLYMGYPIEVKDAENGKVIFTNDLIRSNRNYELKIYTADGGIETRYINTVQDYNQQNKGEIEYNISFRENNESKKYAWNADVYYGITNDLTIGLGNKRILERNSDGYKFLDEGRMELTYSNQLYNNKVPIIIRVGNDKTLTSDKDDNNQEYSERYKYDGLVQINTDNWMFKTELEKYGKFYKEKYKNKYEIEYGGFDSFTLGYEYEERKFNNSKEERENKYKIYYDKGLTSNLLLSSEVKVSDKNEEEYRLDLFYTGFSDLNVNWRNSWKRKSSNYETELELYSSDFYGIVDYSFGIKYSEQQKERVVFSFTIDYDNFFKVTGWTGEKGNRNLKVGVDRIVDLKDIKAPMDALDSSRVKVISFIDENNNSIYDKGEMRVDNVEVRIGNQELITDEKGEAIFHGVPNNILLDLRPIIRKPSYSLGNNVIKIKGIATSTIEAYIPVKPMLTLNGSVELDKKLKLSPSDIQALYSDILIEVKDAKGNEIELTMPDETGHFMVSGIFPERYYIEVKYLGDKFKLPVLKEILELGYKNNSSPKIILNVTNKKISLDKF